MSTATTDMEKVIKKFNAAFRKDAKWNPYGDETATFYSPTENGYRKVSLGYRCEFLYSIENNQMFVHHFFPTKSDGHGFGSKKAEYCFMYMLGMSGALNLDKLTIKKEFLKTEDFDVFYKYGFSVDTDKDGVHTFTLDFQDNSFHLLRVTFEKLENALTDYKKEHKTVKVEWLEYGHQELVYKFSYYAHGIKGVFHLISLEGNLYLAENAIGINQLLDNTLPLVSHLRDFFGTIKEEGKFHALMSTSDVIYNDIVPRKLAVEKETHSEILSYVVEQHSQEEVDTRLVDNDFSLTYKFRHTPDEIIFTRILDVFFIYKKANEELQCYSKNEEQKAKDIFSELATKTYNDHLLKELKEI